MGVILSKVKINISHLRLYIKKNRLLQSELADKLNISKQRVNQFFTTSAMVTTKTIERIASVLNVDASELIKKSYKPISKKRIQKDIIKYLKQQNYWYTQYTSNVYATSGISNIIACQPATGKFVGITIKRPECSATKIQRAFIAEILKLGGIAFVATSVEDVKKYLT